MLTPSSSMKPKQRRSKSVSRSHSATVAPLTATNPPRPVTLLPCCSPPQATIEVVSLLYRSLYFSWTTDLVSPLICDGVRVWVVWWFKICISYSWNLILGSGGGEFGFGGGDGLLGWWLFEFGDGGSGLVVVLNFWGGGGDLGCGGLVDLG